MADHVDFVLDQWRREWPELDRSPMGVVGRINRLSQVFTDEIESVFAQHGLNGGEFDVLATLRRHGSPYKLTPTELCRATMVTSGGMTKRLTALEGRGLVKRTSDQNDRRSKSVELTPAGRKLVDRVLPEHTANQARLIAALGRKERTDLARLLAELAESLGS
jgi:DNA-binding MarR family transcriptional regulator